MDSVLKFLKFDRIDPSEMFFTPVKYTFISRGKNFIGQAGLFRFWQKTIHHHDRNHTHSTISLIKGYMKTRLIS